MSDDGLRVQVSVIIRAPEGVQITKGVLDQILQRLANNQPLPKVVTIKAIGWQNYNRRGRGALWRWAGTDPSDLPANRESTPRGSLQSAIDTLAPFIETGEITF